MMPKYDGRHSRFQRNETWRLRLMRMNLEKAKQGRTSFAKGVQGKDFPWGPSFRRPLPPHFDSIYRTVCITGKGNRIGKLAHSDCYFLSRKP